MDKVKIRFNSAESRTAFLTKLFSANPVWMWHKGENDQTVNVPHIDVKFPYQIYPSLVFRYEGHLLGNIHGPSDSNFAVDEDMAESVFKRLYTTVGEVSPIVVRLNTEYTARVTDTKIVVGCQTFPVSIVDDLTKAIAAYKVAVADREAQIVALKEAPFPPMPPVITDVVPT